MDLDHAQEFVRGKSWLRLETRDELRIGHELHPYYCWWDKAPRYMAGHVGEGILSGESGRGECLGVAELHPRRDSWTACRLSPIHAITFKPDGPSSRTFRTALARVARSSSLLLVVELPGYLRWGCRVV